MATHPRRTCVACREGAAKDDLVRLVRGPEGQIVAELSGRLPGRGAWLHLRGACVAKGAAPLARALEVPSVPDLRGLVRAEVLAAARDGLSFAAAAGVLVGGAVVLQTAVREGRIVAFVIASDAAERSIEDAVRHAPGCVVVDLGLDREALGTRIGRGPRAVLGVVSSRSSSHLIRQLRRLADLR